MPIEKTPGAIDAEVIKEPSLKEILDDKANSRDFKKWLEGQGKSELGARLVTRKLESADMGALAEERKNFWNRKTEAGEVKQGLGSKDTLKLFVDNFAELRRIKELTGDAGLKEAMETVVDSMSLEAGDDHKEFYEIFTAWRNAAIKVGEATKVVGELVKGSHLTQEEVKEVSSLDDPKEREERIKALLASKDKGPVGEKGFWLWKKKAWTKEQEEMINVNVEKFSGTPVEGETKSGLEKIEELEAMIETYKVQQQEIVLGLSYILSYSGAQEINRIILGEKREPDPTLGFKEMRQELEKMKKSDATAADFFRCADEEFTGFIDDAGLPLDNDDQREEAIDLFYQRYVDDRVAKAVEKGGIWDSVYRTVVEPFLQELLPELKKEIKIDENRGKLLRKKKTK